MIESSVILFWSDMIMSSTYLLYVISPVSIQYFDHQFVEILELNFFQGTWYGWTHGYALCRFKIFVIVMKIILI